MSKSLYSKDFTLIDTQNLYDKKMGKFHQSQLLKNHVADTLGAIARPEEILFVDQFPETFSGKNLRRVLRIVAMGENIPDEIDLSTLNTTERTVLNQWAEDVRKMREK